MRRLILLPKFKYIVNCNDKKACAIVRKYMKENDYKYIRHIKGSLVGDHSGIKQLPSLKAARKEAKALYQKHMDEIYQICLTTMK